MEVAAGIAGIISLGLAVSHGIVAYYSSFQNADSDVQRTVESARGLEEILRLFGLRLKEPSLSGDVVNRVNEDISNCSNNFRSLQKTLAKVNAIPKDHGLRFRTTAIGKRALYPFKESTLAKLRENCCDAKENLALSMDLLQFDVTVKSNVSLNHISSQQAHITTAIADVDRGLVQAAGSLDTLALLQQSDRCLQVHEWLSPLLGKADDKQTEILNMKARQDRGALKLMRSSEFVKWNHEAGGVLWCTGAKGTGKTVIASMVIDGLRGKAAVLNAAVAYAFFNYKETESQTPTNITAEICHQVLLQAPDHLQGAVDLYERYAPRKTRPSLQEYTKLLRDISQRFSKVIVVLDALDEAPEVNESRQILISQLKTLGRHLSLVIFSRPDINLEDQLSNAHHTLIEPQEEDIVAYIEDRLSQSERMRSHFARDPSLRQKIFDTVVPKARGMFLLARLYLDSIVSKGTLRQIKSTLDCLPNELFAAYDDAIDRIKLQDHFRCQVALRIIHWIFLAYGPLKVAEVKHALAVEDGDPELDPDGILEDDQLITSCVGMVVVNEESGVMSFVHFTVQEYLEHQTREKFQGPQVEIAQTCLTYLLFENFAVDESLKHQEAQVVSEEYPLLCYAAQYWGDHVRCCDSLAVVEDKVLRYLSEPRATFRVSADPGTPNYTEERQGPLVGRAVSPVCLAASFGLTGVTDKLVHLQKCLHPKEVEAWQRALHIAVINDFPAIVKILLDHGTDVNALDGQGWTPLHHAGWLGRPEMVSLLLQNHADPKIKDRYLETPLSRTAERGHSKVVEMLLESGSEIDSTNVIGQTAAHNAASMDHEGVLRVLVRWNADLGIKDHWGYDPWYRALEVNQENAAQFLFGERMKGGVKK